MQYKVFDLLPSYGTNTYLVWDEESSQALIIDMAAPSKEILEFVSKNQLNLKFIVCTHGHADHIGGVKFIREHTDCKVAIHRADAHMLTDANDNLSAQIGNALTAGEADILMEDGEEIKLGKESFKVIHTPGHTQGSICLLNEPYLFSGDTLFQFDIGRTDLPGGDHESIIRSIREKLFTLDDKIIVLPGHGPASSIEDEKAGNPAVGIMNRYI
jgi:glyoxylase-like metal-dependent hydrolase (beta-lactamase superfamily II)